MKMRKHTMAEIAAKLEQADAMSSEGRLHQDIAKALGVSVMTYHRWRKARGSAKVAARSRHDRAEVNSSTTKQSERINELQVENSRLRSLVTDLLLEKMSLEESIHSLSDGKKVVWR
jgi:putative transposase